MNIGTASARRKEREREALRLHSEGLSIKQSADLMGVSIESVRRYLRSNGVPFVRKQKPRGKKLPCGSITTCHALLVMLFENGCGKSEIASMCGCSESNVANYLIRSGMVRKKRRTITDSMKQEIAELASQGVSYYEIGEAYGMHHASVSRIARSAGIVRGKGGGCVADANKARLEEARARIEAKIGSDYEIVELRPGNHATLRCRACGATFDRKVDTRYPTTCPECRRKEIERHAEERELSSVRRALVRTLRKVLKVKEREERERAFLDAAHVCKECGREFTMRELDELCDHTCYICGRKTEWDDYRIDDSGSFVAGDMYPSIDHVIPIANGGTHTKDNLRIAHRICNSIKGDRSIEYAMEAIASRLEGVPS